MADSAGRITAYLRPANWKFGDTISPSGYLAQNGGLTPEEGAAFALGSGIHTIATGDMNGDGLFDLVVGKGNGRIVWAANKGMKDSPKFDAPADLTGEKPVPAAWQQPSQWEIDTGISRGNFLAYANCVTAEEDANASPPEGTRALKFGYASIPDSPAARINLPGTKAFRFGEYEQMWYFYDRSLSERILDAPSRTFMMQQPVELQAGKTYTLNMRHKGSGVVRAHLFLGWWGFKQKSEARLVRGERGAVTKIHDDIHEHGNIGKAFRPTTSWSLLEEKATITFKNRELRDVNKTHKAVLIIAFELAAPDGFLYLDDLKLVPQT